MSLENAIAAGAMGASYKITPPEGYGFVLGELGKPVPLFGYRGRDYGDSLSRRFSPEQTIVDKMRSLYGEGAKEASVIGIAAKISSKYGGN